MMIIFTIISKEKFNEILRSESEEVKYNRIGEYNSYDKILQLFDHRRRSNNFDEKYLYIFSDLDNLDDLFSSNVFKNLLNDEENLFRFIVYFKSLIWKHIVFEFEECISNKTIREIDHIYSIIVKVDNFIDKISKHLQNQKTKSEDYPIDEILNNLNEKLNGILNQTKFIPNQIDKIHDILSKI